MDLWVSDSAGTARPEEVLQALGLADLLESGAVLERNRLELRDEHPELAAGPLGLAQDGSQHTRAAPKDRERRPTSLLPGPMSFET